MSSATTTTKQLTLATIVGYVGGVAILSTAVSAPLVQVANLYNLHLFPRNDAVSYDVSRTHLVSQVFHVLALAFFVLSTILNMVAVSIKAVDTTRTLHRHLATTLAATTVQAAVCHFVAIVTLLQVAQSWKRKLDHLPIPPSNIQVKPQFALYLDFLSLPFVTLSTTAASIVLAVTAHREQRYVQLE